MILIAAAHKKMTGLDNIETVLLRYYLTPARMISTPKLFF